MATLRPGPVVPSTNNPPAAPLSTPLTTAPADFTQAQVRDDGAIVHRVAAGDTPLGIAFLYDLPLEELYALNGLQPGALLQIDQELVVGQQPTSTPTEAPPTATATAVPTETPGATPTEQPIEVSLSPAPTSTATTTPAARSAAVVAQVEPESTVAATATPAAADSKTSASSRSLMWLAIAGVVVVGAAVVLLRRAGRS